ncbi:uncharacterized protein PGTG_00113 [Puccinia graminis f. sp. tritici CRL 75-36-700-3]|uniref:Centromere protein S n=1 Tax=Puccinia graminis f. sp. tritici (strain CRL 75-36-700-3 / race SCCL) TaxID=418459 RepID=E3JQT5_PUCGT|nr:uncharacterized protein PGTG_00113 [Puccinia graminis f. sp. tritici CRL 75-36-700-3]EFP74157.1 hypothetical protein PGTG_00113 [Puccinia graminis f. sp. tritici CRL 75-36-700-3]
MVRARTTTGGDFKDSSRKRKPTDGEDSIEDLDVDPQEEQRDIKDDGDEQTLTTGIDETSLKAAVWYTVAQIAQEEEIELGRSMSEPFVASLTELVYAQAENLALELKAFAAHAGRSTIREEDVKLVCRKSSVLKEMLEEEARRFMTAAGSGSTGKTMASGATTKNAATSKAVKKPKPKPTRIGGLAGPSSSRNPIG